MTSFNELKINQKYIDLLKKSGIKEPTEVQVDVIPKIFNKRDIIVQAPTGSGKTLSFALPIIQGIKSSSTHVQTLILVPTRELALQISQEFKKINVEEKVNIVMAYGGKELGGQIQNLENKPDIVVGTPGRILDLVERNAINLQNLNTLILDEVDQMLLMGFRADIDKIIEKCNKRRQTLCFSATVDSAVKKVVYKITKDPLIVTIENDLKKLKNIRQYVVKVSDRRKLNTLATLLNMTNPFLGIIFCRTKARVDKLEEELSMKGYSCQKLHGDIPQSKRERIMKSFKNTEFQFLIATDIAARGLDITGITHIFSYDITEDAQSYVHRIGRTGRAGEKGEAYLFVTEKDLNMLKEIQTYLDSKIPEMHLDYELEVVSTIELPKTKYNKKINATTRNIEEQRERYKK